MSVSSNRHARGLGGVAALVVGAQLASCAGAPLSEGVGWNETIESSDGDGGNASQGDQMPSPWPPPPPPDDSTSTSGSSGPGMSSTDGDDTMVEPAPFEDVGCGNCAEDCFDGLDNDGNGFIDCGDASCSDHVACTCAQTLDTEYGRHVFCTEPVPWQVARDTCEASDLQLVTIDDATLNNWLADQSQAIDGSTSWWMGYSDLDDEGDWEWVDGSPTTYENWHPGEPNNGTAGPEHCAGFPEHTAFAWNDLPCGSLRPFICVE